jgi:hypothetical protein
MGGSERTFAAEYFFVADEETGCKHGIQAGTRRRPHWPTLPSSKSSGAGFRGVSCEQ